MLTFPRASSSLPAELSAVELCWLMILIALHTAWLSASGGGRESERTRETKTNGKRERKTEEKNSLTDTVFFFLHNLCFHGNHTIWEEMGEYMYRKKRRGDTTGLQVKLVRRCEEEEEEGKRLSPLFSFVCCQAAFVASVHTEEKHAGVVSIRDNASMGLTAGCRYPQRMVPLTPDKLCQLQRESVDTL